MLIMRKCPPTHHTAHRYHAGTNGEKKKIVNRSRNIILAATLTALLLFLILITAASAAPWAIFTYSGINNPAFRGRARATASECKDALPNCKAWRDTGLCSSTNYPEAMKRLPCRKTCGLC